MTDKRSRGRPKGTGKKDDHHLDAVADLLVRQSELKKTPAISQIAQKAFPEHQWEAAERRLLRKWNKTADERLEAAKERYAEERRERRATRTVPAGGILSRLAAANSLATEMAQRNSFAREMQEALNPPNLVIAANHLAQTSSLYDAMLLAHTSPLGWEHVILSVGACKHPGFDLQTSCNFCRDYLRTSRD